MTDKADETARSVAGKERSLWRNRDFLLLWIGQTVSEVGSAVTMLAIPFAAIVLLNASTLQVGILSAVGTLPFLLVSLPAGAIVDRTARHKLMMWCDLGRMLLIGSIPFVVIPGVGLHLTFVHLLVVALLNGILAVFFDVAYMSYLPVLVKKDELIDANSKISTTAQVSHLAGPSIGGALIGLLGAARALTVDAISYGVSALSLFLIRAQEPTPETRAEGRKMRHEIAEGLEFVFKHAILRKLIASIATVNFASAISMAMSVVFLVRVLDVSPGLIGLIWSVTAVGGVVGAVLAGRLTKRFGVARTMWTAPLVLGFPMLLQPLAQPGWGVLFYVAGYFSFSLYAVVFNVAQRSYCQAITPPDLLGRMNASMRFVVWGTLPAGAALGGVLGSQLGVRETIWIGVVGIWLSGFWLYFSPLRNMRDVEAHQIFASTDADSQSTEAEPVGN